jgi:hypothetical protein
MRAFQSIANHATNREKSIMIVLAVKLLGAGSKLRLRCAAKPCVAGADTAEPRHLHVNA